MSTRKILRPHQVSALTDLRQSLAKGINPLCFQAPTGFGKSATLAELALRVEQNNKRTWFVVDSLDLLGQLIETLDEQGCRVGVMQSQHERTNLTRPTQVCSQATLAGWLKGGKVELRAPDVCVIDECHQQYVMREEIQKRYPNCLIIGATATPTAKGMGSFYRGIVFSIPMQELIDMGFLSPFRIFAPSYPDMKGVKRSGDDYNPQSASEKYDMALVADIVQTWEQHSSDRQTLMFACNVAHSKAMVKEFQDAGHNCEHVDGYPTDENEEDRHSKIERYKAGEIQILSSVALLTKGFDNPATSCLIVARPTKSLAMWLQICGRGLRTFDGKDECLILDHSGNSIRHGFPTDITEFVLDDGSKSDAKPDQREKGEKLPVPCPACHFMKPAGTHMCPNCFFAPEKKNEIENIDGELVEVKSRTKDEKYTEREKDDWMRMFKQYEIEKGKKNGYSINLFRDKFGHEPRIKWPKSTLAPSTEVSGWIRHRNIRFAKSRKAA